MLLLLFCLSPLSWRKVEKVKGCLKLSWLPLCLTVLGNAWWRHCQVTIMFCLQPWRETLQRKLSGDPGRFFHVPCLAVGSFALMSQMGNSTDSDDGK